MKKALHAKIDGGCLNRQARDRVQARRCSISGYTEQYLGGCSQRCVLFTYRYPCIRYLNYGISTVHNVFTQYAVG